MHFENENLYHIFNQGNNRQKIFFTNANYLFFVKKIKTHIKPFADILAWCLMPNHFHLMLQVKEVVREINSISSNVSGTENIGGGSPGTTIIPNLNSLNYSRTRTKTQTFQKSIGIMLSSYSRAINEQENRTGSIFRKETKSVCLNEFKGITPAWFNTFGAAQMYLDLPGKQFPQVCFNYIHNNPFKAGIVEKPEDWEFSSIRDIRGSRNWDIVNLDRIKELNLNLE